MAHMQDFLIEYRDKLEEALTKGKLKQILELWLDFIVQFSMKAESKLNYFDELFG